MKQNSVHVKHKLYHFDINFYEGFSHRKMKAHFWNQISLKIIHESIIRFFYHSKSLLWNKLNFFNGTKKNDYGLFPEFILKWTFLSLNESWFFFRSLCWAQFKYKGKINWLVSRSHRTTNDGFDVKTNDISDEKHNLLKN